MFPWHLFPLLMQGISVIAAIPALAKLHQQKRSDQRAIADHGIALLAQIGTVLWAHAWAHQPGIVASSLIAAMTTCVSAALIVHYRLHPGGRAPRERTLRAEPGYDRPVLPLLVRVG